MTVTATLEAFLIFTNSIIYFLLVRRVLKLGLVLKYKYLSLIFVESGKGLNRYCSLTLEIIYILSK